MKGNDLPPIPPGFQIEKRPVRSGGKIKLDPYNPGDDVQDVGTTYTTTGKVVDGDTIKVNPYLSARLSGFDAFEQGQPGYRPGTGQRLDLGALSTSALTPYIRPSQPAYGTGAITYGRPVVTLGQGQNDPVPSLLRQGAGYAAPEYLSADPERAAAYMESERLGRMNRQGGFGANHIRPDAYRRPLTERTAKLAPDEYLAYDDQIPADTPKLKRLTPEQEKRNAAYIASNVGNPNFNLPEYQRFFREELGVTDLQPNSPEYVEAVRKGGKIDYGIDYSTLDAESQQALKELIAFSGMRPEVAQEYRDLLNKGDTQGALAYGKKNGMDFDPADIQRYVEARRRGEQGTIPLPLIDPGEGRLGIGGKGASGAFQRGVADPVSFFDEMGAVADTLAPSWMQSAVGGPEYRETVWNSDRSFGDIWGNNARQNRGIIGFDEKYHPIARTSGQIAGGFLLPYGGGIRGALNFGKVGAIEGGVNAFGAADGSIPDRLKAVPGGVAIGGTLGLALGKGEELLRPLVKQGVSKVTGRNGKALGSDLPPIPEGFTLERPQAPVMRADMASDGNPSIAGPRLIDTIDVGANRPTRLLDGPTEALLRANASKVGPDDILPRMRDELSPDEAQRLGQVLYPEIAAPSERDYLDTLQYPSPRNPDVTINRKGPAALVTFARAQGGLRDEGGELAAAGISNAARKGEDFAGGENRLGRLVDQERGLSFEDMAQRAYDEGYFPELDAPPTRQQLVAALDDTYRGVGRRFRPEDEAQIQAFEGARDQRLAVERARQEGAPLAEDIGQPITYEDLVANTPPATGDDVWGNAVASKVGNIRLDKLNTADDISRAIESARRVAGGFDAASRGRMAQAETRALAQSRGMTVDQLLARRKGQAFNAEDAYAARILEAKSSSELVDMAKKLKRMGDDPVAEAKAGFLKAVMRHAAIMEHGAAIRAEAGRALSQFKMVADSRELPGRVLEALVNRHGGSQRVDDLAEAIIDLERDPARLNRFVEMASKPRFRDKATELYYNWLLSGPQTHAVNMLSNTMTAIGQLPETAVAASVGAARRAFSRNAADRVTFSEVGARSVGMLQGAKEGLLELAKRFRANEGDPRGLWATAKRWGNAVSDIEPTDFITKIEGQGQQAISGVKGKIVRLPSSALTAEDEFFKSMARRSELHVLAMRKARAEGLRGQEAKDRTAELIFDPTEEMMADVMDYARYMTFQRPLGPVASKVSAMTNDMPILKLILPFVRTPTNLMKFAVERSPLAPMLKEWRRDFAARGARRDTALARAIVGSSLGAVVAELAGKGLITGASPSDRNAKGLKYADGWQPYSIKIGDTYYSYKRLDPFALTIGAAADLATTRDGMTEAQRDMGAARVTAAIMGQLSDKTWLSGISSLVEALEDPDRSASTFVNRTVGTVVPTGVAQVARTIDPTAREAPDALSYIQSRIPGLSDNLLPKRDVWGRPIVNEGGVGPDIISPIWTSRDRQDPISEEALRVGATISPPSRKVAGERLSAKEYDSYQEVTGQLARRWVGEAISSPGYKSLSVDDQAKAIEDAMSAARKAARAHVLDGEPLPSQRPVKGKKRAPAALPPIPEGFQIAQ